MRTTRGVRWDATSLYFEQSARSPAKKQGAITPKNPTLCSLARRLSSTSTQLGKKAVTRRARSLSTPRAVRLYAFAKASSHTPSPSAALMATPLVQRLLDALKQEGGSKRSAGEAGLDEAGGADCGAAAKGEDAEALATRARATRTWGSFDEEDLVSARRVDTPDE